MSAPSYRVIARLAFVLLLVITITAALPIDPQSTISLSFFTGSNDLIPGNNATIDIHPSACIQIPSLANSFRSNSNTSVFAIYQDINCKEYVYSVSVSLANIHGARSLAWVDSDATQKHEPGETFTDPSLTSENPGKGGKTQLIVIISLSAALFLIALGIYLCYMDNKKNLRRGGYVPEPSIPTDKMAEVYQNSSRHGDAPSSSSVSFLPPYGTEDKSAAAGHDGVTPSTEAGPTSSPTQRKPMPAARYQLPMTRERSFSKLTNKVGTGAGLEPGAVQQGRNAGFGLGYDIEEHKRHLRRDSDIILRDACMTPPHSPIVRPSSVVLDENGMVNGPGGIKINPKVIHAPA
ncbi:MAG: hypothetical protein J3Q66DRAFT_383598 [Benniella sp.]|nr:MAG: hypothetical protein J3Q66DRAFT_383598 [Benniella sp.]